MNSELLIQKLLKKCQNLLAGIQEDLDDCANIMNMLKRKDKSRIYFTNAYDKARKLESALDELAGSALDFERLFKQFYNDAATYDASNVTGKIDAVGSLYAQAQAILKEMIDCPDLSEEKMLHFILSRQYLSLSMEELWKAEQELQSETADD